MDDDALAPRPVPSASAAERRLARSRGALLLALAVDNAGSGLFLPLAAVYLTEVVGLPTAQTGVVLTAGSVVGLVAPPVAGRVVDRAGPRVVVVASQLLQALGVLAYLLARGSVGVVGAAALVAAGTQTFYSSLVALVADTAPAGPRDRSFALVDAVRSAAFGAGALVSALLLWALHASALRLALAVDLATFVVAAAVLALLVRGPARARGPHPALREPAAVAPVGRSAWRDRPFLALIVVVALLGLPSDLFLVGGSFYALHVVHAPWWVPGACTALLVAVLSAGTTTAVRLTAAWPRTRAMAAGAWCLALWAALAAAAQLVPVGWRPAWLLATTAVLGLAGTLVASRANALAEAAAPPARRGRHLAAFQYAFTAAGLGAAPLVSGFAAAPWLPWTVVAAAALAAALALPRLAPRLPAHAVHPPAP